MRATHPAVRQADLSLCQVGFSISSLGRPSGSSATPCPEQLPTRGASSFAAGSPLVDRDRPPAGGQLSNPELQAVDRLQIHPNLTNPNEVETEPQPHRDRRRNHLRLALVHLHMELAPITFVNESNALRASRLLRTKIGTDTAGVLSNVTGTMVIAIHPLASFVGRAGFDTELVAFRIAHGHQVTWRRSTNAVSGGSCQE